MRNQIIEDKKLLLGIVSTTIVVYNFDQFLNEFYGRCPPTRSLRYLLNYIRDRRSPLIPVGTVKALYVYPVKSCKGKSVFAMYCDEMGPHADEMQDRQFLVINGNTGRFYTGRQKPCMVLIDCEVQEGVLTMSYLDSKSVKVNLADVVKRNDVRRARLFNDEHGDGLDCGEEVAAFLTEILQEPNTRLLMYRKGLFSDRGCVITRKPWNVDIPLGTVKTAYQDDAPYMINTQASLDALNERLEEKVNIERFRPVILVDKCDAWDEDNWLSVHIGDVALQCLKPCLRCVMTTISTTHGTKDPSMEPLKTLRKFRLAPEGPMRDDCKENPMFGVDAGIITPGYIHVGQTVYVRYKNAYRKDTPFYKP